jgi:hypothetical protein
VSRLSTSPPNGSSGRAARSSTSVWTCSIEAGPRCCFTTSDFVRSGERCERYRLRRRDERHRPACSRTKASQPASTRMRSMMSDLASA